MDDWEKINETSLPKKEGFHSHLNGYRLRACKDFEIKNLGEYHDLHVQSDTFLLADVFDRFRNICLKIYFSSWVSMASSFKKD